MYEKTIYKAVIHVPCDGLITYRFDIAADNAACAKRAAGVFLSKRGLTEGFNARTEIHATTNTVWVP